MTFDLRGSRFSTRFSRERKENIPVIGPKDPLLHSANESEFRGLWLLSGFGLSPKSQPNCNKVHRKNVCATWNMTYCRNAKPITKISSTAYGSDIILCAHEMSESSLWFSQLFFLRISDGFFDVNSRIMTDFCPPSFRDKIREKLLRFCTVNCNAAENATLFNLLCSRFLYCAGIFPILWVILPIFVDLG